MGTTKNRRASEHAVQASIVAAIRLCGFAVYETTAYRQKGPSGVDKGIADLLIPHPTLPWTALCMEIKRPGDVKWSSLEQELAFKSKHFTVAQSIEEALAALKAWLWEMPMLEQSRRNPLIRIDNVARGIQ